MGEYDKLFNTGNEILKEVTKAVETGNYDNLSNSLKVSIEDAVRAAKQNPSQNFSGRASTYRSVHYAGGATRTPFFTKKISGSTGIGRIIAGAIGLFTFGATGFGLLIGGMFENALLIPAFIVSAIAVSFAFLIKRGVSDKKLAGVFRKYGSILGNAEYFAIKDLAVAAGERSETVYSNIFKMIEKDFLPTARFDKSQTTVMLSERAYAQYLQAEKSRQDRELAEMHNKVMEAEKNKSDEHFKAQSTSGVKDARAQAIIKEGNEYLESIRKINDEIPGDEMSEKLYQLESIMRKIFTQVEKEPECADDLKKFMNYYLPTTKKLLNAYVDLDKQPEVGDNITKTKKEIEGAIDVINAAFENLLDSLFQDMAWDISSDISVMKTMMAQDGLTQDGLQRAMSPGQAQDFGSADTQSAPQVQTAGGAAYQAAPQQLEFGGAAYQAAPQAEEETEHKPELKF